MANKLKANIGFQPIVTEVSRKFVPKKQTCKAYGAKVGPVSVETQGWMGAAVRKSNRGGLGYCERNYMVIRENARITPPSAKEMANRTIFAAALAGRNHILHDLNQVSRVQILWTGGTISGHTYVGAKNDITKTINGVSGAGYTFNGWVMAVQFAGKSDDPQYDVNTFPSDYDA